MQQRFPDLLIAQLIRVHPIKEIASNKYGNLTLKKWAAEAGISNKQGNIKKEIKKKFVFQMPKEWDFRWESDGSRLCHQYIFGLLTLSGLCSVFARQNLT